MSDPQIRPEASALERRFLAAEHLADGLSQAIRSLEEASRRLRDLSSENWRAARVLLDAVRTEQEEAELEAGNLEAALEEQENGPAAPGSVPAEPRTHWFPCALSLAVHDPDAVCACGAVVSLNPEGHE